MKKKICILGSTGSIGITTLNIIKRDKKKFNLILLSTNNNVEKIYRQANEFKPKNIIILNKKKYLKENSIIKDQVYNNFKQFNKIFKIVLITQLMQYGCRWVRTNS